MMAFMYNADEIYRIGLEIEKNGKAFYEAAGKIQADDDMRRLFLELAQWEESHVDLFLKLHDKLPESLRDQTAFDSDEQSQRYLEAVADSHIFIANTDIESLVNTCDGPADIIKIALQFEKDSVVLYSSMKTVVPESLGKSDIDRLINEEIAHVWMLQQKLNSLI